MSSPVKVVNWSTQIRGHDTALTLSVSSSRSIAIVGVNQAQGIGSVFDASSEGVECLVGTHHDGLEEALARALTQLLSVKRVILTVALREYSPLMVKELLAEIRKFQ